MNYYIRPNIFTHVICTNNSTLRTALMHSYLFLHLICVWIFNLIFISCRQMHYNYNFNKTTILYFKKSTSIRDKKQFCFKDYDYLKQITLSPSKYMRFICPKKLIYLTNSWFVMTKLTHSIKNNHHHQHPSPTPN